MVKCYRYIIKIKQQEGPCWSNGSHEIFEDSKKRRSFFEQKVTFRVNKQNQIEMIVIEDFFWLNFDKVSTVLNETQSTRQISSLKKKIGKTDKRKAWGNDFFVKHILEWNDQ